MKNYVLIFIVILFLQLFLVNILTIKNIRPDLILIFVLYLSVKIGSSKGIIAGFCIGIIIGLLDNSVSLGLSCLVYSVVGYLGGRLQRQTYKMLPFQFYTYSLVIVAVSFMIFNYFTFNNQLQHDFYLFIAMWIKSALYTISIAVLLQFVIPLQKI